MDTLLKPSEQALYYSKLQILIHFTCVANSAEVGKFEITSGPTIAALYFTTGF